MARPFHLEQLAHDTRPVMLGSVELHLVAPARPIGLRQGDGAHAEHGPPSIAAAMGARIADILGNVLAAIDAGEDQIRLAIGQDRAHRHDDAIRRRALHGKMTLGYFAQAQRIVERERMRDAALIRLGRDDDDVVRQLPRDRLQRLQAGSVDAVVIGAEDAHGLRAAFRYG